MTEPYAHLAPAPPESVYQAICRAVCICRRFDIEPEAIRLSDAKLAELNREVGLWNGTDPLIRPGSVFMGLLVGVWDTPGFAVGPITALGGKVFDIDEHPTT